MFFFYVFYIGGEVVVKLALLYDLKRLVIEELAVVEKLPPAPMFKNFFAARAIVDLV
jgi:hypothetical protein